MSFFWMFFLILFLYGFSSRFSSFLLIIPILFFGLYSFININIIRQKISNLILFYFILLTTYCVLLFIGGILGFDFQVRVSNSLYIVFGLLPLFFIFYCELKRNPISNIFENLFLTYFIISIILFLLLYYGYFNWNRYQHVGNILAATAILSFGFKKKKKKWILFLFFLTLCLLTGSRQSLIGMLFVGIIFVLLNKPKILLYLIILTTFLIIKKDYFIEELTKISNEYNLLTLRRLLMALTQEGGGASVSVRVEIYNRLFNSLTIFPNLIFSPNSEELFPHNFFLQYALTCGVIIGSIFTLFILYILLRKIITHKKNALFYFSIFYFVPFSVSSGIAAAKYLLFYLILIIFLSKTNIISSNENKLKI